MRRQDCTIHQDAAAAAAAAAVGSHLWPKLVGYPSHCIQLESFYRIWGLGLRLPTEEPAEA